MDSSLLLFEAVHKYIEYTGDYKFVENQIYDKGYDNADNEQYQEEKEKTVEEVFNTLSDEQKDAVYEIINQTLEDAGVTLDE